MENARKPTENEPASFENELRFIKPKFDGETGLRDLLLKELKSMYYVEKVVSKAFPKLIKNACNYELIEAISIHQEDTKNQISRIEIAFDSLHEIATFQIIQSIHFLLNFQHIQSKYYKMLFHNVQFYEEKVSFQHLESFQIW